MLGLSPLGARGKSTSIFKQLKMVLFPGLRSGPFPPPPSVFSRLIAPLYFALVVLTLYVDGIPKALWYQITHPHPLRWISPWAWRDLVLKFGFSKLLVGADTAHSQTKAPLISFAQGRILEVGAGSGMTIKYYDPSKVEELIAVEPFTELHSELASAIDAAGLTSKTKVLSDGIDKPAQLAAQGVTKESFDTIVLVQVLCSIPRPKESIAYLTSLLKPGGQLLIFEHIASKDRQTRLLQNLLRPFWLFTTQCCDLVRDSGDWVAAEGVWKSVELGAPVAEDASVLLPHAVGRLVKA